MTKRKQLFSLALICLLLGGCAASAQTFLAKATPQSEAVLNGIHDNQIGIYAISLVNTGATQPLISIELVEMQFPTINFINPALATTILTTAQGDTPSQKIAKGRTIGLGLAGAYGGLAKYLSAPVLGYLASGTVTGNYITGQLKALAVNIGPISAALCPATLSVPPAGGTASNGFTCMMFADPTTAATPSVGPVAGAMMAEKVPSVVPPSIYRKHGVFGLGRKTLIVVAPPIQATFTVAQ